MRSATVSPESHASVDAAEARARLLERLDGAFLRHVAALEAAYASLPKPSRVRVERWVTALSKVAVGRPAAGSAARVCAKCRAHAATLPRVRRSNGVTDAGSGSGCAAAHEPRVRPPGASDADAAGAGPCESCGGPCIAADVPIEWVRNRNQHSALLLQMVLDRRLTAPFNTKPPQGALPRLASHHRQKLRRVPKYNRDVWRSARERVAQHSPTLHAQHGVRLDALAHAIDDEWLGSDSLASGAGGGADGAHGSSRSGVGGAGSAGRSATGSLARSGAAGAFSTPNRAKASTTKAPDTLTRASNAQLQRKVAGLELLVAAERKQIEGLKASLVAEAGRREQESSHLRSMYARHLQALTQSPRASASRQVDGSDSVALDGALDQASAPATASVVAEGKGGPMANELWELDQRLGALRASMGPPTPPASTLVAAHGRPHVTTTTADVPLDADGGAGDGVGVDADVGVPIDPFATVVRHTRVRSPATASRQYNGGASLGRHGATATASASPVGITRAWQPTAPLIEPPRTQHGSPSSSRGRGGGLARGTGYDGGQGRATNGVRGSQPRTPPRTPPPRPDRTEAWELGGHRAAQWDLGVEPQAGYADVSPRPPVAPLPRTPKLGHIAPPSHRHDEAYGYHQGHRHRREDAWEADLDGRHEYYYADDDASAADIMPGAEF